jgi:N-acetylglucosaminyldiphosphoundecaprenol N-acetyl-beta-D-mannosaminyltransferase
MSASVRPCHPGETRFHPDGGSLERNDGMSIAAITGETEDKVAPPANRRRHPASYIHGLPINCTTREYVLAEIERAISARESGHYVCVTNPEIMYRGLRSPSIGDYIRNSDFSVCDGVGVIVAGLAWGHLVPRFSGPTLQLACSERGAAKGWRHFYYGGKAGVADEMARRLTEKYPGLIVCGTYCPPFGEVSPEEDARIVEIINRARPDIVWVGLSVPAKEQWVAAHLGKLDAPWVIGVGAAFDYHSGAVPWAPAPVRAIGMEWLYRLIVEPKVRAKRTWWHLVYVVQAFLKGLLSLRFLRPSRSGPSSAAGTQSVFHP